MAANNRLTGCYSGREVRQERRLRLLRGNRLSAWEPISQTIAQFLVRSWDNGWDNRRGSTRDRIALKRRQRNDLVGFELFLRSQTLYPTELRAHPWQLHYLILLTPQLQLLIRPRFWSILEQHKQESRTRRRLFPLLGVSVPVPRPCGNKVRTSSSACDPSKNC